MLALLVVPLRRVPPATSRTAVRAVHGRGHCAAAGLKPHRAARWREFRPPPVVMTIVDRRSGRLTLQANS